MRYRWIIIQVLLAASICGREVVADPGAVKGAIVPVVAKGVVPALGNAPAAVQGTGFFVSQDGFLVTSYHIRSNLKDVDEATVTYEILFSAADVVAAAPVYINPAADLMILYAPVGDRDVQVLKPADRSGVVPGVTQIFTAGYPEGYQFTVDQGIIKSFGGLTAPVPAWTTSITFKYGQSGSPILLADNRVIAIAKATDKDATSIGLIVPIRLVPAEFWDGSLRLTAEAASALPAGGTKPLDRVVVEAVLAPTPTDRQAAFELRNATCEGTATKTYRVTATPGWKVDPSSIKLETSGFVGSKAEAIIADRGENGFTVAVELSNYGGCLNVLGTQVASDVPASFRGHVTYNEVPGPGLREAITITDVAAIGNVMVPLPNPAQTELRYFIVDSTGTAVRFQPIGNELSVKKGFYFLDTAKVLDRLGEVSF